MNKSALRISRYRQALTDLQELQEGVGALNREIEETVAEHKRERPLTREEKSRIRDAVLGGRLLCCDHGRGNLRELLDDPIWIDTLHKWAYERTGCSGEWERHPELVVYCFWRDFDGGPKSHIVDGTVYGSAGRWAIRCPCSWVAFHGDSDDLEIALVRHVVEAHEGTLPAPGS